MTTQIFSSAKKSLAGIGYALLAGLFTVPMILLTIWPAAVLTPGRMGILLMSEVVVGIGSVALLAGEPFGPFEAMGAALEEHTEEILKANESSQIKI